MLTEHLHANKKQSRPSGLIIVKAGELIPCDGVVIEGLAFVDESAVAGVSTPALIENAPGRNSVMANTLVVEGSLTIQCN